MKRLLPVLVILASTLIQGCVLRGPISPDYSLQHKKTAVIADLGRHFQYVIVGTTIFTNNISQSDVTDWHINHTAASHVIEKLAQRGVNAKEIESDVFTALENGSPHTISTVQDQLIAKAKSLGYQSLLMVKPTTSENYPFHKPGYGLHTRYFFGTPKSCIYAMYIVELYDLERDKTIGWDWVNGTQGPCVMNSANDIPIKENFDQFSANEKQQIRVRLEQWLKTSLDITLKSMNLVQ